MIKCKICVAQEKCEIKRENVRLEFPYTCKLSFYISNFNSNFSILVNQTLCYIGTWYLSPVIGTNITITTYWNLEWICFLYFCYLVALAFDI